ncbi:hypothetical protein F240042I4_40700 [Eisenbergiella tayi]
MSAAMQNVWEEYRSIEGSAVFMTRQNHKAGCTGAAKGKDKFILWVPINILFHFIDKMDYH